MIKYLLLIITLFSLAGCGGNDSNKKDGVHLDGCKVEHCWIDAMPDEEK